LDHTITSHLVVALTWSIQLLFSQAEWLYTEHIMPDHPNLPDVLFFCEYLNIAWGVQYDGILITRRGGVYRFGEKAGMGLPPNQPKQTRQDYFAWVCQQAVLEGQVDPAELAQQASLVEAAAQGKLESDLWSACDTGRCSYLALRPQGGGVQEVVLEISGDEKHTNTSPEAAGLVSWLKGLWKGSAE
jgi:hypothetical protein